MIVFRSKRRIFVLAVLVFTATAGHSANPPMVKLKRMFKDSHIMPTGVVDHKGKYYVSDMKGNRILVFDRQEKLERTVGVVGSGQGELLRPGKLAISGDDLIYVFEGGNERVQIMTTDGKYVSHFPAQYSQGFAINSKGEVLLGQAEKGKLVSVYSRQGQPIRSFGGLHKVSDFYGDAYAGKNQPYELLINRVDIYVDRSDNTYVTFLFAPVLQKYDPAGRLLWEARLQGPDIDKLVNLFLTDEKSQKFIRVGSDRQHANLVLVNSVVNEQNGHIYVLLPDKSLCVLDRRGNRLSSFSILPADPKDQDFWPQNLAFGDGGAIFGIDYRYVSGARFMQ